MAQHELIKLFEENKIRVFFDDEAEQWFFCINDVISVLTESANPGDYFKKMRRRDSELDHFMMGTNCPPHQFVSKDGRRHAVICASLHDMLRIIQSIPSKKAEPFKQWLAHVAKDGAEVARNARADIEQRLGHSVISNKRAIDYITPQDELPFEKGNQNQEDTNNDE